MGAGGLEEGGNDRPVLIWRCVGGGMGWGCSPPGAECRERISGDEGVAAVCPGSRISRTRVLCSCKRVLNQLAQY